MRLALIPILACGLLGSLTPGAAQAQTPPTENTVEDVVVVGRPLREAVQSFVEEVGVAQRDQNLARWDRRVCIGVVNMNSRYAQAMVDQVSAVAMAIGLRPGDPGCRPNVLILADSDGDALARWMVEGDPQFFRPDIGNTNLGPDALEYFQSSSAPIRWWQVTAQRPSQFGPTASRIRGSYEEGLSHIIIILDMSRIGTVSFASLADYVSMVSLAQVDSQVDASGFDSVLNLFAENGSRSLRMTDWDLAYLRGLYTARGDAADPERQQREISFQIRRQLEAQGRATEQPATDVEQQDGVIGSPVETTSEVSTGSALPDTQPEQTHP